jgi:hypothetical protein
MSDPFASNASGLTSPATEHYVIVPNDDEDLPVRPRAIYVDGAGTAALQDANGQVVSYNLTAGQVLTIRPTRVLEEGTTAELIAWY